MTNPPPLVCATCGTVLTEPTTYGIAVLLRWPPETTRDQSHPVQLVPEQLYCQPCFDTRRAQLLGLLERRYPKAREE